jgi:hypothetical protein
MREKRAETVLTGPEGTATIGGESESSRSFCRLFQAIAFRPLTLRVQVSRVSTTDDWPLMAGN